MIADLEYKISKEPLKELKLLLIKIKIKRLSEGSFLEVLLGHEWTHLWETANHQVSVFGEVE